MREVTLVHRFGSVKRGLMGQLRRQGKTIKAAKVYVPWPLSEPLIFNALTGKQHCRPKTSTWTLSDEDIEAFGQELRAREQ